MKGIIQIFKWSKKYLPLFFLTIALSTVLQWLYSYLPLFIQYVFNVLEENGKSVNLPSFLIDWFRSQQDKLTIILMVSGTMILLQLIRSIMRFADTYLKGMISQLLGFDLRNSIYSHVTDLSYTYHNNVDTGDLIQRATSDVDVVGTFISSDVPNFINIFVTVGIGAYQVFKISPILMLVSLALIPVTAISSIIYFRYCNKKFDEIEEAESQMTTVIQENVNGARVVRAFANEKYEFEKMDKASIEYKNRNSRFINAMAAFWGFSDCSVYLQYAATLTTAIFLAKNGVLDTADIIAAMLLMGMVVWPMRSLGRIVGSFGKASVAAKRINEVLDKPSEFEINGTECPKIKGNIEFKNVSFKFDDEEKHLLNDVSFKIKAGQTVALVGKTGSGKSTICNLLVRFLEYDKGSITIDGVELKNIEKKYLRQNIKYVLQDPFLFSKTVYENISISEPNASRERIIAASRLASIDSEIEKFELGYDTVVGEKGTTLSGGQKQRVAIARMLVSDSNVIIFDDSLSALDTKTDLMIRNALKENDKSKTMIIITHRTTTAKEADLILVLDEGKIVQAGTHDELVKKEGLYSKLWGIQGDLEKEFINVLRGE